MPPFLDQVVVQALTFAPGPGMSLAEGPGASVAVRISEPKLWSPDRPHLYGVRSDLQGDSEALE